jgi:RNA polymerase sigma factor (TIGR02999 family)
VGQPQNTMQDGGDAEAQDAVWKRLYPELKQLARSRLRRSGPNAMLETTGLVNEAFLRMADGSSRQGASSSQFLAYAARTMRSVVVDLAREAQAQRRGGDLAQVTLNTAVIDSVGSAADDPLRVDEALRMLAKVEPRLSEVVEMRYFGGFSEAEIAQAFGVTERTIRRDWSKASLLLRTMLSGV